MRVLWICKRGACWAVLVIMGKKRDYKARKPGAGRKPSKPGYDPSILLQKQMDAAVSLYGTDNHPSLQTIADELELNPIKVRKLLITAGVYESEIANQVQGAFNTHKAAGLSHTEAIVATMRELNLSKASVTSYLPYEKGVYFPAKTDSNNLSVGAERICRMRKREKILEKLRTEQTEEALWAAVIEFQGYKFRTYSGLVFSYSMKRGRGKGNTESESVNVKGDSNKQGVANKQGAADKQRDIYTKELFIDRRENSKSLAWSSVALAFRKTQELTAFAHRELNPNQRMPDVAYTVPRVDRPKALGDIRGVTYIYAKQMDDELEVWLKEIKGMDRIVEDYGVHVPLWESIMNHVGGVNCAWERTAFEEGLKAGIRLMMEVNEDI